jgi:AraC family transcriptional regulator of adaptative response/methylated-DNA-[protein]-cysteine methyltransferase
MPRKLFCTPDARWKAVVSRDKCADGFFYYAVKTTGIYCRPWCASRPPRRENVEFFTTAEDVERAGYRPCQRCRPSDGKAGTESQQLVTYACRLLEQVDAARSVGQVANAVGVTSVRLQREFKKATGLTPKAYALAVRENRLRAVLSAQTSVTRAALEAGFASSSSGTFHQQSAKALGMTPRAYRSGGAGQRIRFAVGECWLGAIAVAATEKGICAIALGSEAMQLASQLKERFPQADLAPAGAEFRRWVTRVIRLVKRPELGLDLPLDVQGTAFQQRVWQLLREIPCGETATYAEIAQRLGEPKAVRAVASAIAANPLAVAIPCHRVVRTGGALSGYRWGVERKEKLLARESKSEAKRKP